MSSDPFRDALTALTIDASLVDGFAVERQLLAPPLWRDCLTVQGRGAASLRTLRAPFDPRGTLVGEFATHVDPAQIGRLASLLHDTKFDAYTRATPRSEAAQLCISALAGGFRKSATVAWPPQLLVAPMHRLLAELDGIAAAARRTPLAALAVGLSVLHPVSMGENRLRVALTFQNQGTVGAWVSDPSALGPEQGPLEALELHSWAVPVQNTAVTALPPTTSATRLHPVIQAPRPYLWLAPGVPVTREFDAAVAFGEARPHFITTLYSSYVGEDVLVGRARVRGAAFSNVARIDVA